MGVSLYDEDTSEIIYPFSNTGWFDFFQMIEGIDAYPDSFSINKSGDWSVSKDWYLKNKISLKRLERKLKRTGDDGYLLGPLEELISHFNDNDKKE